jgi:putative restriction endonuclease
MPAGRSDGEASGGPSLMALTAKSRLYFLQAALQRYTEDFRIISPVNPVLIEMNGQQYSVHISSVHDSGEGRANPDEQRIQVSAGTIAKQSARSDEGITALFIGFFPDGEVFTAWTPEHVFAQKPGKNGTVYARYSHRAISLQFGAALRVSKSKNLGNIDVATIAMRADCLGLYLENAPALHELRNEADIQQLVAAVATTVEPPAKTGTLNEEIQLPDERVVITITRTAFARDPKFRQAVLQAYDYACCVCGRQMGLVQAAHIIPHSHPDCIDQISNGLALCIEHHRLYDVGLLLLKANRKLLINVDMAKHLENIARDAGLDDVRALEANEYRVPEDAASHPDNAFLERGVRIRLGTDT